MEGHAGLQETEPRKLEFPQHPGTVSGRSDGITSLSQQIRWRGGRATSHYIESLRHEADVIPQSLELIFSFRSRVSAGEVQSYGRVMGGNRTRSAFILPAGIDVAWRARQVEDSELLIVELDNEFILRSAELEHLSTIQISEAWFYEDPLSWQLAASMYSECVGGAPQGLLFIETAATLLALHLVRSRSPHIKAYNALRRGGLSPTVLRRSCDYMMNLLTQDLSLEEVASVAGLSPGHFSLAFKRSVGVTPFAWVRRQRVDRVKYLLADRSLSLPAIAEAVGYANQSALGVAFRKETGLTLTQWRRAHL